MSRKNQLTTSDRLDYAEFQRFLECLHNDGEYMFEMYARVSFCTACRVSDVSKFTWGDLLNKSSVTVTEQKTGKTRQVPLNGSVQKKFHELYELLGRPDLKDLILHSYSPDKCYAIQHINRKLKEFKERYNLKIDHFSTHTFRKTFGRYVYEKSDKSAESLILLNKILNHANLKTTQIYIGILKDEINNLYNSIDF